MLYMQILKHGNVSICEIRFCVDFGLDDI